MNISVIIPTYNESGEIAACLNSLLRQSEKIEIIVVDDGSIDTTVAKIIELQQKASHILFFKQSHLGPAAARNLGAAKAIGDIYVFIDADMTFDANFIAELVEPIRKKIAKGTFTKAEYVANWENIWARCWNYNQNIPSNRRIPENHPDEAPVFRALLANEFKRVGGYDVGIGWTDDWTLSRKLGYNSVATNAVCYHTNPHSLHEVFHQAQWIGKNEFYTRNVVITVVNIFRFAPLFSFIIGVLKSIRFSTPAFLFFKIVYDCGIVIGLIGSLVGKSKNK